VLIFTAVKCSVRYKVCEKPPTVNTALNSSTARYPTYTQAHTYSSLGEMRLRLALIHRGP